MKEYLILAILSFLLSGVLFVPFINLLYKLKFQNPKNLSVDFLGRMTIFNKLHGHKVGTPTGGGILIILIITIFTLGYNIIYRTSLNWSVITTLLSLVFFGILGFIDDTQKFFRLEKRGVFGLRIRHKFLIQLILSFLIAVLLYKYTGKSSFGFWYIPYATLLITFFANAFNITDGLDGLSGGLLMIIILAIGTASIGSIFMSDISIIVAITFGAILAFMYFNISPARIFMGDTGALAFGAVIAVMALLADVSVPFILMGGVFAVEGVSSLLQWWSMAFRNGKRIFKIAPLHHHFEALGWEEPKVVMRFWLAGIVCALFGLLLSQLITSV